MNASNERTSSYAANQIKLKEEFVKVVGFDNLTSHNQRILWRTGASFCIERVCKRWIEIRWEGNMFTSILRATTVFCVLAGTDAFISNKLISSKLSARYSSCFFHYTVEYSPSWTYPSSHLISSHLISSHLISSHFLLDYFCCRNIYHDIRFPIWINKSLVHNFWKKQRLWLKPVRRRCNHWG